VNRNHVFIKGLLVALVLLIVSGTVVFSFSSFTGSFGEIFRESRSFWENLYSDLLREKELEDPDHEQEEKEEREKTKPDKNKKPEEDDEASGPGAEDPPEYPLPANSIYTYTELVGDLHKVAQKYPEIADLESLGKSVEGKSLWALNLGRGNRHILVVGSSHAREWITTPMIVEQINTYARNYHESSNHYHEQHEELDQFSLKQMLHHYTIWFVPMINPDGVTLVQKGPAAFPERKYDLINMNAPGWEYDFHSWKANIRGVDLNRQYNVQWEETRRLAETDSRRKVFIEPAWANYGGNHPESEPESRALAQLIRQKDFDLVIDYHASGNTLFWYYGQEDEQLKRDKQVVKAISDYSGYRMERSEVKKEPNTTLVRWVVKEKGITGVTIEVTPFTSEMRDMDDLPEALEANRYLVPVAIKALPEHPR